MADEYGNTIGEGTNATTTTYQLESRIKGNTFEPFGIEILDSVGTPLDISDIDVEIEFNYKCNDGKVLFKEIASSEEGAIWSIEDEALGLVKMNEFLCDWDIGTYYWSLKLYFGASEDNLIVTYAKGYMDIINGYELKETNKKIRYY